MNDFLVWATKHSRPWERSGPLTEAECDELFKLFTVAGLPATAMTAEMADGYIAGCVVSPNPVPIWAWMETVFGQGTLPVCANVEHQERLLQLLTRRLADTHEALRRAGQEVGHANVYVPLLDKVPAADCIQPYQLDDQGLRIGRWQHQQWARGFMTAVREDEEWERLIRDPDAYALLGAAMLFLEGYNREHREMQVDAVGDLPAILVQSLHKIVAYWRDYHALAHVPRQPYIRETSKVGRNDPCHCGSGKKHKKCCGAH